MNDKRYIANSQDSSFLYLKRGLVYSHPIMTNRKSPRESLTAYNPPERDALTWGVRVLDAGFEPFPPGKAYPSLDHHPAAYLYKWDQGRVFSEYQILAITRGSGILETATCPNLKIEAGDIFILFPGEWHRFRPDLETGWDENFLGFDGDYAHHLMQSFFTPGAPVLRGAATPETLELIRKIAVMLNDSSPDATPLIFADIITLITRLVLFTRVHASSECRKIRQKISDARERIIEKAFESVDFRILAADLGLSYSVFRRMFKKEIGHTPLAYQINIRISRARVLLEQTDLSVSEIAQQVGFANVFYFSKMFSKRVGQTATGYRRAAEKQFRNK
ncbi:MAG: AraC family transcriptional regulator [Kiritimatiellae bacterium]|jgi:AraC-like DNA-binding protein|nr:AraC family transcriptional regulator [Kiritimatiellia bacterium]